MFKLRLVKGRSYTGNGIKVTAANPFTETDSKGVADVLAASGYFSIVSEPEPPKTEEKPLEKMSEKELEAYAAENGIDISGLSKKADKLAAIQRALAEAGEAAEIFGEGK